MDINDVKEFYRREFGPKQKTMNPKIGLAVEVKVRSTPEINKLFLPGEIGAVLDWEVRDSQTGEIMPDPRTGKPNVGIKKAESFTRQMLDLLQVAFNQNTPRSPLSIRDTGNTLREISSTIQIFNTDAGIGDVTFGIIIGTGNTAPAITNYVIETIIPHATMSYSAMAYGAPASDATTSQFTMTRNFANVSGGNVTVNEIALYVKGGMGYMQGIFAVAPAIYYFMTLRDVIAGGITVPNGQTLTINYRPQVVV